MRTYVCSVYHDYRFQKSIDNLFEARQYCSQRGWNCNQPIDDNILKNNIEKNQVKEAKYNELKKGIFMKRSKASTCRELLNQIRNLSSVVYHNDALDHLHDELVKLIEALKFGSGKT